MKVQVVNSIFVVMVAASGVFAQSGGPYEIKQSVIAGGGGTSTGGTYSLSGTLGQPAATNSGGSPYVLRGGFWQADLAPTAAMVFVSGRVVDASGNGIAGVTLVLSDSGGSLRQVRSSPMGYFTFEDVEAGESYILSPTHKTRMFAPRVISVQDEVTDLIVSPIN